MTAIALVAVVGLLVAACGSSSPSASSSSPSPTPSPKLISKVDACTLVTAAEASTTTGKTLANLGGASAIQVPGACLYSSSDGATTVVIFGQAYPDTTTADAVSPEQIAAAMNAGAGLSNTKTLNGIGDKAIESTINSGGTGGIIIIVFKANVVMMIAVTPAVSSNALEQLARTAAGRL